MLLGERVCCADVCNYATEHVLLVCCIAACVWVNGKFDFQEKGLLFVCLWGCQVSVFSVLQRVAVWCSVLQCIAGCGRRASCLSACVVVMLACCSVMQCGAVCCRVLQSAGEGPLVCLTVGLLG